MYKFENNWTFCDYLCTENFVCLYTCETILKDGMNSVKIIFMNQMFNNSQ